MAETMKDPFEHPLRAHSLPPEEVIRRRVKAEIRKRMRGLRKTTPLSACLERSRRIVEALVQHLAADTANRRGIALFFPIEARHEVDLRDLDRILRENGARIFYPAIDPESRVMTFKEVLDPASLEERGYGFSEPPNDAAVACSGDIDVIVVPALAIDEAGHRIGYGAGYYDQAIPRFAPPAVTIGVAYDYQLISEVPVTEGDVALEWIVTDRRVFRAGHCTSPGVAL